MAEHQLLNQIFENNEEYTTRLIRQHYCNKTPNKSLKIIREIVERDSVYAIINALPDRNLSEKELLHLIKEIVTNIRATNQEQIVATNSVLEELRNDPIAYISKVGRKSLLLKYWVDQTTYNKLILFHAQLLTHKLIRANSNFTDFQFVFTTVDPLSLPLVKLIKDFKELHPIIWVSSIGGLKYFINGLCKKCNLNGMRPYQYSEGLITLHHQNNYNLRELKSGNHTLNQSLKKKIDASLSVLNPTRLIWTP